MLETRTDRAFRIVVGVADDERTVGALHYDEMHAVGERIRPFSLETGANAAVAGSWA